MTIKSARRAAFVLVALCLSGPMGSASLLAQKADSSAGLAPLRVRIALVSDERITEPQIQRFKDESKGSIILVPAQGLTPERLAAAVRGFTASVRVLGKSPSKDMVLRAHAPEGRKLDSASHQHYAALLQRLRSAPLSDVEGVGRVPTTGVLVNPEPRRRPTQ
ncbi:MAG: hypothetical protein JWM95_5186 [Gemmatimonadetes bacterium]|nr:hypothetical protein [Gemmatimonadota bacterium]